MQCVPGKNVQSFKINNDHTFLFDLSRTDSGFASGEGVGVLQIKAPTAESQKCPTSSFVEATALGLFCISLDESATSHQGDQ